MSIAYHLFRFHFLKCSLQPKEIVELTNQLTAPNGSSKQMPSSHSGSRLENGITTAIWLFIPIDEVIDRFSLESTTRKVSTEWEVSIVFYMQKSDQWLLFAKPGTYRNDKENVEHFEMTALRHTRLCENVERWGRDGFFAFRRVT